MNHMVNGSLPPRRKRRKRRRFTVYYGLFTLVLFLFSGVLYTQAADVFFEKEEPSQPTSATESSEDLAASPKPADLDKASGDEDIELKQEKPDENNKKPLKEKAKDTSEIRKPGRTKSVERKSPDLQPPVEREENPVTAFADQRRHSQPSAPKADTPSDSLSAFEEKVVELVNQERSQRGLAPLKVDVELSKVARVKSEDMRDNGYFSHDSPTYGSPSDMMRKFGIQFRFAGENIAAGYPTPEAAVKGWMNSSGHRSNILSSEFTHIGIGYAKGGPYGHYWTQQFISK